MSIPPKGEIGEEVHEPVDQVLAFVEGTGVAILDGEESPVGPDRLVHVPAGMRHNFVNRGSVDLRLLPSMRHRSTRRGRSTARRPRPTQTRRTTSSRARRSDRMELAGAM